MEGRIGLHQDGLDLNQDAKDERMDQELGTDQDLWDGRIFQDHDYNIPRGWP
ncbi:hypothetical protein [Sphingobacterium sp. NPDC055431]